MCCLHRSSVCLLAVCGQNSLTTLPTAMVDVSVGNARVYDKFQFERTAFFSVDPDSTADKVGWLSLPLADSCEWIGGGLLVIG